MRHCCEYEEVRGFDVILDVYNPSMYDVGTKKTASCGANELVFRAQIGRARTRTEVDRELPPDPDPQPRTQGYYEMLPVARGFVLKAVFDHSIF